MQVVKRCALQLAFCFIPFEFFLGSAVPGVPILDPEEIGFSWINEIAIFYGIGGLCGLPHPNGACHLTQQIITDFDIPIGEIAQPGRGQRGDLGIQTEPICKVANTSQRSLNLALRGDKFCGLRVAHCQRFDIAGHDNIQELAHFFPADFEGHTLALVLVIQIIKMGVAVIAGFEIDAGLGSQLAHLELSLLERLEIDLCPQQLTLIVRRSRLQDIRDSIGQGDGF